MLFRSLEYEIRLKLDDLTESHIQVKINLAEQILAESTHQKNVERFWSQTWPQIIGKIDDNATKIATLEVEVAELRTKMMIWGVALCIGVPVLATVLQILLENR